MAIDYNILAENAAERRRLQTLAIRLSDADLQRDAGGGWTVTVAFAHLAFWDRLYLRVLEHWATEGMPQDDPAPDAHILNDDLRGPAPTPGIVSNCPSAASKGAIRSATSLLTCSIASSMKSMWANCCATRKRWWGQTVQPGPAPNGKDSARTSHFHPSVAPHRGMRTQKKEVDMVYDFHTHTYLSDGALSPTGLAREACVRGYKALAITDHVGIGNLEQVVRTLVKECEVISTSWDLVAIPGVEITHVPKVAIANIARQAKDLGAKLVVVHGETIWEPVEPGTNLAALECRDVDILAHPGLISETEARLAAERGVFLELSARKGHCLTNGHVARAALQAGASLLLNSDAHDLSDLLTDSLAQDIARGAGLPDEGAAPILKENPAALLRQLKLLKGAAP